MTRRAIFLEKDGMLVENAGAAADRPRIQLAPAAVEGLRALAEGGFRFIVASNQPGVAFGLFPFGALAAVAEHLRDLFLAQDLALDGCYWCPHHPEGVVEDHAFRCSCRKPMPGLMQQAADEHGIDLAASWVVAEGAEDVEAARRAGCRAVLLDARGDSERNVRAGEADLVARTLAEAAEGVLRFGAYEPLQALRLRMRPSAAAR